MVRERQTRPKGHASQGQKSSPFQARQDHHQASGPSSRHGVEVPHAQAPHLTHRVTPEMLGPGPGVIQRTPVPRAATGWPIQAMRKRQVKMSWDEFAAKNPPPPAWGQGAQTTANQAPTQEQQAAAAQQQQQLNAARAAQANQATAQGIIGRVNAWGGGKVPDAHAGEGPVASEVADIVRSHFQGKGHVNVLDGPGTGDFANRQQLKIIHKTASPLDDDKRPTYHVSY